MKHRNDPLGQFCSTCVQRPPYSTTLEPGERFLRTEETMKFVPDHRALRERITLAVLEKCAGPVSAERIVQVSDSILRYIADGDIVKS